MRHLPNLLRTIIVFGILLLTPAIQADTAALPNLPACNDFAFSTEEDFLTHGPTPSDGNPIISDGDLLSRTGVVCARNRELLAAWEVVPDLGLDAVDIIDVERGLVVFSTELDDPRGRFKSGDLLGTNGLTIPNLALLTLFQVGRDLGLDGVQFIGPRANTIHFMEEAAKQPREYWLTNPGTLIKLLREHGIDIWISTEGTELTAATTAIFDGDILSVRDGTVVVNQAALLPPSVPAGIPARGVDFGIDALTANLRGDVKTLRFSTEILFRGEPRFTDGDIIRYGNGVEVVNSSLVAPFEPKARFLGLDALYIRLDPQISAENYLPIIKKNSR